MCSIPNTTIILLSIVRTDIDIFRFFVFSYFLFSLKVYLASILFSFMQYWANNRAPEKTSFFSTIALLLPSNELIFYRIDPLGFIGIRLPVLRKSVCCVCVRYWFHTQASLISGAFFTLYIWEDYIITHHPIQPSCSWSGKSEILIVPKLFPVHHTYVWLGLSLLVTALCSTAEWWCIFHFAKQDYYDPRREWLFFPSFVTEKSPPLHFGSD